MMRLAFAVLAAVAVPAAAWHVTTTDDRLATGLTAAPFGWPRLMLGHLATAVPLAFCLARRVGAWGMPSLRGLIAVGVTAAVTFALPSLAEALADADAGFTLRVLLRSLLATFVATSWLALGVREPRVTTGLPWVATLVFAVVPPLLYAHRLAEARATDFETFAKSGRLVRTMAMLEGLRDLGSSRHFGGKSVAELIPRLRKDLDRMTALAAVPLGGKPTADARLHRAMLLIRLNRATEAEAVLDGLDSPTASLIRAAVAREAGRWSDLARACREVIDRPADSMELLEDAFDGLGEAERHLGRPDDAAATYRAAAGRLPHRAGYYAYQLGLLAADRGRFEDALTHFAEAVHRDPSLSPTVAPQIRRVRSNTPSCLNWGSPGS